MALLYFDIETRPAPESELKAIIEDLRAKGHKPDARVKKEETKAAKLAEWEAGLPVAAEAQWRRSSLSASDGGQVLCIGYHVVDCLESTRDLLVTSDYPVTGVLGFSAPTGKMTQDEGQTLRQWWDLCALISGGERLKYVGYNVLDFDLPFLWRRSIVNQVRPQAFPSLARYRTEPVYDLMQIWGNWRDNIKLDKLCRLLGIPSPKDGIDGSQVWQAICDGRDQEVADYCQRDTDCMIEIHNRMDFISREPLTLP